MDIQSLTTELTTLDESEITEVVKLDGGIQNHVFRFQMG